MDGIPACANCGQEELTLVHAAARGWLRVLRMLMCGTCARHFPGWMQKQF